MDGNSRIFVAGGTTLTGAALLRLLAQRGILNVVGVGADEPDLTNQSAVDAFFDAVRPTHVFVAAGKSAGIRGNQLYPADLIRDNLLVQTLTIDAAYRHGVRDLVYLASSCSYPKHAPQPMAVDSLLTGPLEITNEAYAVAKIAGIKFCQALSQQHGVRFIAAIPANVFGCEDDFSPDGGHVIPGLIRRFHNARLAQAPTVELWGTGTPRREFIFADDLADACLFSIDHYGTPTIPLNLGGGQDLSIREAAEAIADVVGYRGQILCDTTKPDGMPLKSLDSSPLLSLGWSSQWTFRDALARTYEAFLAQESAQVPILEGVSGPNRSAA